MKLIVSEFFNRDTGLVAGVWAAIGLVHAGLITAAYSFLSMVGIFSGQLDMETIHSASVAIVSVLGVIVILPKACKAIVELKTIWRQRKWRKRK